jgi:hypothetical protein
MDINGSTAFTNTSFNINPSNALLFPWLSNIAANFSEYRFKNLRFCFNSTSANALNSTNTALGQVIMTTNYNAA